MQMICFGVRILIEMQYDAGYPLTETNDIGYGVLHGRGINCGEVHREVNTEKELPPAGGCFIIHIRFADKEKSILLERGLVPLLYVQCSFSITKTTYL